MAVIFLEQGPAKRIYLHQKFTDLHPRQMQKNDPDKAYLVFLENNNGLQSNNSTFILFSLILLPLFFNRALVVAIL